ncbi:MAG: hypothetical protein JWN23_3407 [Rhodocyclales bacterium]|nr:hypothetical protein [Rhodocyclales bacterium]
MRKSVKAALWSGLVLPGSGYFIVKRPLRGVVVLILSLGSLGYLINSAMQQAAVLMDKAMSGDMPTDAAGIEKFMAATPAGADTTLLNIATFVLVACWLFSIVDGYRIGRDEERKMADALPK